MEWLLPWNWHLDESMLAGMLGGAVLGIGRLLMSLHALSTHHEDNPKYKRLIGMNLLATLLFALVGASMSWALTGRAGDFIQGLTGILMLVILAGKLMPANTEALLNAPLGRRHD